MPETLPTAIEVLRERMAVLVSEQLQPLEAQLPEDPRAPIPPEIAQQVRERSREAGMWSLTQPIEFGGAAVGVLAQTAVREALAAGHLRVARYVFGPGPGLLASAQGQLKDHYLDAVLRGEKRGAFAFTEASGERAAKPTWATWDGDDLLVTGHKSFVTGGATADYYAALVNVEAAEGSSEAAGPAMLIIDRETPGVTIDREFHSLEGGSHVELSFAQARVPAWHVIGEVGEGMPRALGNIGHERLAVAAQTTGLAVWAVDFVDRQIQQPHRTGGRLADREGIRLRYADIRIAAYAMRSVLYRTARLFEEQGDAAVNEVMAAKVFCTEQAGFVIDQAVQLASGGALVEGHPLERAYREIRSSRFTGGASDILRLNISRGRIEFDAGRV
ncbi:MAG: acyl-CoA dehydrogenase [Chloroflexi bacterium]|nr:acyl-CoA dehydrogenase [Chloroflexota bacterium]MDA1145855.1 acyl-CoA dehydrogenase [Chloroflexota bacterium]